MNQKSLIHLYNSMFDETESEEEIKDSANDSHNELNGLSKQENPELFDCILYMIKIFNIPHESNEYLKQNELDKFLVLGTGGFANSFFTNFKPKDGDFSIIFKYLKNVKILHDHCFYNCENLIKINIPNYIIKIGPRCFENCYSLKEISLPNSIIEIPPYCFADCHDLTEINIPDSVIEIHRGSFLKCFSLKSISIPKRFKKYEEIWGYEPPWLNASSKVKITYI